MWGSCGIYLKIMCPRIKSAKPLLWVAFFPNGHRSDAAKKRWAVQINAFFTNSKDASIKTEEKLIIKMQMRNVGK